VSYLGNDGPEMMATKRHKNNKKENYAMFRCRAECCGCSAGI
jgi:hypothetical protein